MDVLFSAASGRSAMQPLEPILEGWQGTFPKREPYHMNGRLFQITGRAPPCPSIVTRSLRHAPIRHDCSH
jgi:hypothetical protein